MKPAALLAALALAAAAAAPALADPEDEAWPGLIVPSAFVLFYDSSGTMSYPTSTFKDIPPNAVKIGEVKGQACQYKLEIPLVSKSGSLTGAAGRGGYDKIFADMMKRYPGLRGIYDVKVDDHSISLLGIFERLCTEITAFGFK